MSRVFEAVIGITITSAALWFPWVFYLTTGMYLR